MLKTAVVSARNAGFSVKKRRFLNLTLILSSLKNSITLIISIFCVMPKISVFVTKGQCAGKYQLYVWSEQPFC